MTWLASGRENPVPTKDVQSQQSWAQQAPSAHDKRPVGDSAHDRPNVGSSTHDSAPGAERQTCLADDSALCCVLFDLLLSHCSKKEKKEKVTLGSLGRYIVTIFIIFIIFTILIIFVYFTIISYGNWNVIRLTPIVKFLNIKISSK